MDDFEILFELSFYNFFFFKEKLEKLNPWFQAVRPAFLEKARPVNK
jgi:hypothetical protein